MKKIFETSIGTVQAFINSEDICFRIDETTINGVTYKDIDGRYDTQRNRWTTTLRASFLGKQLSEKAYSKVYTVALELVEKIKLDTDFLKEVKQDELNNKIKRLEDEIKKLNEIQLDLQKDLLELKSQQV